MIKIRLNKYLASRGVASRRNIDKLISDKHIEVNGVVVSELGTKVDPLKDKIKIDGEEIKYESPMAYLILNKPKGVLSATSDEMGRKVVVDLVDSSKVLHPVGRLDQDSRGLILLTNDGELSHKLTHPKYHIDKTYLVTVVGEVTDWILKELREGINLKDGKTAPAKVEIDGKEGSRTILKFTIYEGRHRQIRRMCGAVNLEVLDLQRIAIGPIEIGSLAEEKSRPLTAAEVDMLKKLVKK